MKMQHRLIERINRMLEESDESSTSSECIDLLPDMILDEEQTQLRAEIEEVLVDNGLTGRELTMAGIRIESLIERFCWHMAAGGLKSTLEQLGPSPMAEAIRRRLLGDTTSLRDAARKGRSHEAIRKAEARLELELTARC